MTWYYVKDGEAAGPISDEELLSKLRLGAILPVTLLWRSGMAEWQPAAKVAPEIIPAVPAPLTFSPALDPNLAVPPELTSGTPPVLPHFFCTYCGNIIPADQLVRISGRAVCGACKPLYVQQAREGLDAPIKAPVVSQRMAAMPAGPNSDLADPAIRFVAHLLDLLFLSVPVMIGYVLVFVAVSVVAGTAAAGRGNISPAMASGFFVAMLVFVSLAFVWAFGYWTYFLGGRGATPGMKIMKVKMVRSDRGPLGYGRAFGRTLALYMLNAFTMSLTNITAFFDKERRTVIDMLCDTRVVRN